MDLNGDIQATNETNRLIAPEGSFRKDRNKFPAIFRTHNPSDMWTDRAVKVKDISSETLARPSSRCESACRDRYLPWMSPADHNITGYYWNLPI